MKNNQSHDDAFYFSITKREPTCCSYMIKNTEWLAAMYFTLNQWANNAMLPGDLIGLIFFNFH